MAGTETQAFRDATGTDDWRVLDARPSAWFEASSMAGGAELVARIAAEAGAAGPRVDLRPQGVRVRLSGPSADANVEGARAISAAAQELGLAADPAALQTMQFVVDVADVDAVRPFWQTVLGYSGGADGGLLDPLERNPAVAFARQVPLRDLRNRMHVDVARPADSVSAALEAAGQTPGGPYGVAIADREGNVVDLVPGGGLGDGADTSDWLTVFGAMTHYRTGSLAQGSALATAVADLADAAGEPLLVDLRPDGVTIDSGKDGFEARDGGTRPEFVRLAAAVQAAARGLGLTVALQNLGFVQYGIDAVDIPAARAFWTAALGYRPDSRPFVTDVYDPRRLNPVIFFQNLDADAVQRRRHRDRVHLDVFVPSEVLMERLDAASDAGGQLVAETARGCTVTDPEGNELCFRTDRT